MRIEEKMLILPALYIIKRRGHATTSDLITDLTTVFNPSGEDAEILAGRRDSKFSQKVRNLVSHRATNKMGVYTVFSDGIYTLTKAGEGHLLTRMEELNYFFSQKFDYEDTLNYASNLVDMEGKIFLYDEMEFIQEGQLTSTSNNKRYRSRKLREEAIKYYSASGRLRCCVCGFDFKAIYGRLGVGFIEMHHVKPICSYGTEGDAMFLKEAVKNIRPVCSNCHRMIHRNALHPLSIDELKSIMNEGKPSL